MFDSLSRQPSELFEWLVVDDGSTDDTPDLLREFQRNAPFPVRTIVRSNGGKHRAHNDAITSAKGELMVVLDSDDELVPGALERLWSEWVAIPASEQRRFAGVIGHSIDESGRVVGLPLPYERVDGRYFELVATGTLTGEKLPCYRTDILRRFPFPERAGNVAYVPEGVVWADIGRTYTIRCINTAVRRYHRDPSDSTAIMNKLVRPESNAWGVMRYCGVVLNLSDSYWPRFAGTFLFTALAYVRYALHSGCSFRRQLSGLRSPLARILWTIALPIGVAAWTYDRVKG